MTAGSAYVGGFADPVFDAQAIFRRMMEAFAAPGLVVDLGMPVQAPAPLDNAAAAILAALADQDTPVWMAQPQADAAAWLRFQTGAPLVADRSRATFALVGGDDAGAWAGFQQGTPDYPDRSVTLLAIVMSFEGGPALRLSGPGLETERTIRPQALPRGFVAEMAANHARFPLGFDLVLICGTTMLGLPRSTRIEEA